MIEASSSSSMACSKGVNMISSSNIINCHHVNRVAAAATSCLEDNNSTKGIILAKDHVVKNPPRNRLPKQVGCCPPQQAEYVHMKVAIMTSCTNNSNIIIMVVRVSMSIITVCHNNICNMGVWASTEVVIIIISMVHRGRHHVVLLESPKGRRANVVIGERR